MEGSRSIFARIHAKRKLTLFITQNVMFILTLSRIYIPTLHANPVHPILMHWKKKIKVFSSIILLSLTCVWYCQLPVPPLVLLRLAVFLPLHHPPWLTGEGTRSLAPRRLQSPIIRRAHIAAHKVLIYLCLFQSKIKV